MGEKSKVATGADVAAAVATFLAGLKEGVKEAVAEAVREQRRAFVAAEPEIAAKLAAINAKQNHHRPEAALLLGCSDSHLYKLIKAAERGRSERPIPYLDLAGVKVLPASSASYGPDRSVSNRQLKSPNRPKRFGLPSQNLAPSGYVLPTMCYPVLQGGNREGDLTPDAAERGSVRRPSRKKAGAKS